MTTVGRSATGARALLLVLSLAAAIPAVPAVGASKGACRVTNTRTDRVFRSLATAVQEAQDGQSLTVRGTCRGTVIVAHDVTISGVRPRGYPVPTLNGNLEGSTLTVAPATTVTIRKLTITGGTGSENGGTVGGGIRNLGTLTLRSVKVTGNTADYGGGIHNNGTLTITGASRVTGNHGYKGGGIDDRGTLTVGGTTRVEGNAVDRYPADNLSVGGGIRADGAAGVVTIGEGATVTGNSSPADGGGIALGNGATLSVDGSATVTGNTAGHRGGGIAAVSATVQLAGSASVTTNSATDVGGGVYLLSATLGMTGLATISANTAANGGGIGSIGSTVTGAGASGGPSSCTGATINVFGNTPDQCW